MILDIKTVILLSCAINFTNVLVLFILWYQNRKKFQGITLFLIAMILEAIGFFLILFQGVIPDAISIVCANVFIVTGSLIMLIGMQKFFRKELYQIHNYFFMLVYASVLIYYSLVEPDLNARIIIVSAIIIIINAQTFYLLFYKINLAIHKFVKLSAMVFLSYVIVSFIRIIFTIKFPDESSEFLDAGLVNSIPIIVYMVLNVLITTSCVLLINGELLFKVECQERKYNSLFFASPYAMVITNLEDGSILEVNSSFTNLMGYAIKDVIGEATLGLNIWASKNEKNKKIEKISEFKKIKGLELELRKKNGEFMTGLVSSEIIFINDKKYILTSISDITEISLMKKVLQEIAMHDSLTQLPNRLLFHDRLGVAISNAQRENKKVAVVFMDIDYLKIINDKYGHEIGDKVLISVGDIFKDSIRKVDTVARFGGDEFVILLWDVGNKNNVTKIIKNIQEKLQNPINIEGNEFRISLSIGISLFPEDGTVKEALIGNADKAMYQAKEACRGSSHFYNNDDI